MIGLPGRRARSRLRVPWDSFRVRLTLWNMGILALVLAAFGVGLSVSVAASLRADTDRKLLRVARNIRARHGHPARIGPGRPPPGRRFPPPGGPFAVGPEERADFGPEPPRFRPTGEAVRPFPDARRWPDGPGDVPGRPPGDREGFRSNGWPGSEPGGGAGPFAGEPLGRPGQPRGVAPPGEGLGPGPGEGRGFRPGSGDGWGFGPGPGNRWEFGRGPDNRWGIGPGPDDGFGPGPAGRRGPGPDGMEPPRLLDRQGRPADPNSRDGAWDPAAARRAARGGDWLTTVAVGGVKYRVATVPVGRPPYAAEVLQVAASLSEQEALLAGLTRTLWTLIPLALVVAGVGGAFLAERALRPVRALTRAAAEIGAEDLSRRLEVSGHDELAELAGTFNAMVARLEGAFQRLARAYEQQRRFAGDASHELRTPLTTLKANTSLALMGARTAEEYRETLVVADEVADTMNRIVQDLLLLARSDGGRLPVQIGPCRLGPLLERVCATFSRPGAPSIGLHVGGEDHMVLGDPHHLHRLIGNLVENSLRHTPPDGMIRLTARAVATGADGLPQLPPPLPAPARRLRVTHAQEAGPREQVAAGAVPHASVLPLPVLLPASRSALSAPVSWVLITVHDTGEGIPAEHLAHVCERFYRVDAARTHQAHPSGGGTGLGLAICQTIIQAHSGEFWLESGPGAGTRALLALQLAPSNADLGNAGILPP